MWSKYHDYKGNVTGETFAIETSGALTQANETHSDGLPVQAMC